MKIKYNYNVWSDQWSIDTSKLIWRSWPGVAALDNKIYVTGGQGEDGLLSRVDCYDPDTDTWTRVEDMNNARRGHDLVNLHCRLYAIGGFDGVDSVEVYDPDTNTWTLLQHKLEGEVRTGGAGLVYMVI